MQNSLNIVITDRLNFFTSSRIFPLDWLIVCKESATLATIEYRKGRAVMCRDFVTLLWGASMQYITKLATSQSHNVTPHITLGNKQYLKLLKGVCNTKKRGDLFISLAGIDWRKLQRASHRKNIFISVQGPYSTVATRVTMMAHVCISSSYTWLGFVPCPLFLSLDCIRRAGRGMVQL